MRSLIAAAAAALLASAAAAGTARRAQPAKPRPTSLLTDTLRREAAPVRLAMAWAPEAPAPPTRARPQAGQAAPGRVHPTYDLAMPPTATWLDVFAAGGSVRVSLELNNVPARDALKQVFAQTKLTYTIDADVPQDARVTARASNIQLHTALNLITEAAGVGWTIEHKAATPTAETAGNPLRGIAQTVTLTYRIGKSVSRGTALSRIMISRDGSLEGPLKFSDNLVPYAVWGREERSTFTCPHCKVQSTLVRVKHQPKCPKCERLYAPEWQFCPADGARRPAPPVEWRFCPSCGKQVQPEKAREEGELLESVAPPGELNPLAPPVPPQQPEPTVYLPRVGPLEDL